MPIRWLPRRKGFDVRKWRAKCQCTHGHESHDPTTLACRRSGCGCGRFISAFCCLVCDRPWEEHETVFESRAERAAAGRAVDGDFMPLSETPNISALVFGREGDDDDAPAELHDVAWRPAHQRGGGGGGGAAAALLPPVAGSRSPSGSSGGRGSSASSPSAKRREAGGGGVSTGSSATRGGGSPKLQQQRSADAARSSGHRSPTTSGGGGGGGGGGGKQSSRPAPVDPFYSQAVREVYAAHAPEKLCEVDAILSRWSGREQALLMRLHKK